MTAEEAREYTPDRVTMNLAQRLTAHLGPSGAGRLAASGTGLTVSRSPDSVPAPDLVVDVLSPGDTPLVIQSRVGEWLVAGTSLVWVVDPRRRTVHVYRGDGTEEFIGPAGALDGEEILRGFSCPLRDIL
ncbi:MAG TPA: Uma2 family endonuclease [Gemmatimonadales bacterium]|jgi:Uma2 family endonuclease|nr:Uma2 family endonuclease [Gemmatimonadales bacterium]